LLPLVLSMQVYSCIDRFIDAFGVIHAGMYVCSYVDIQLCANNPVGKEKKKVCVRKEGDKVSVCLSVSLSLCLFL